MESEKKQGKAEPATLDELMQAIASLTSIELSRLRKAATSALPGTEFRDYQELLNEAILRALNAASGQPGRIWRRGVELMAFLTMNIKGIADDSENSLTQRQTKSLEVMAPEGGTSEDALGLRGHFHPPTDELVIERQDTAERQALARADAKEVVKLFDGDQEIQWLLEGHKDGCSPADVRSMSGMSDVQYASAQRRLRRALEKRFPGRRKS